jgi:hypothetical protein
MNAVPVGREAELERIGLFLDVLGEGPAALVLVGEPGIGKTTLWREGLGEATRRGYRVLASRPVESEARLSYAALADLLRGVEDWLLDELPAPQRSSLEVALLREGPGGAAPDPRAIATAVLAILERLSVSGPVLVALDDAQWLDRPSTAAVQFAARRLTGPVGIFATQRTGERPDSGLPLVMADSDRFALGPKVSGPSVSPSVSHSSGKLRYARWHSLGHAATSCKRRNRRLVRDRVPGPGCGYGPVGDRSGGGAPHCSAGLTIRAVIGPSSR